MTGTLVRPAMLLWKRAWLVELDTAPKRFVVRRTRIVESALAPIETAHAVRSDRGAARSASARFFVAFLPLVPVAWMVLHPLIALAITVVAIGLLFEGFVRRR